MKPARILHVFSQDGLGGTEIMSSTILPLISRSRFSTLVAFRGSRGPVGPTMAEMGLPVQYLGSRFIRGLSTLARRGQFDIVHFYGFKVSVIGRIVFAITSPSTIRVMGIRGMHVMEDRGIAGLKTRVALWIERGMSRLTHHYVANSKGAVEFLTSKGIGAKKFQYIPNGVDPSSWPQTQYKTGRSPLLVCVARMVPLKRHSDLLAALSILDSRKVAFRCDFVGTGPEEALLTQTVGKLGLDKKVRFLGTLRPEDTIEVLRHADLFVLTSDWEGMSRSLMEAMAIGLPVIGTDVNGIRELVVPEETGLLVRPRDPEALADAIERLVKDADLRRQFGQRGRARIAARFSLEGALRQLEDFYGSAAVRQGAEVVSSRIL